MTVNEIIEGFNLRYNNALEGAPEIDLYEMSLYLTIAQIEIVKEYYDRDKDPNSSFELKERARRVLNELVNTASITSKTASNRGIVSESKFYEMSVEPMFIVFETAVLSSSNSLYDGKVVEVIPITHDNFMTDYYNPFRKPNKNKVWRLDISKESAKTTFEVVSIEDLTSYNVRYVANPDPIILTDLNSDEDFSGLGLTIEGNTAQATCLLNPMVHQEVINRAVELAILDYNKPETLQARVGLDKRV
jgi:hypothetical protein